MAVFNGFRLYLPSICGGAKCIKTRAMSVLLGLLNTKQSYYLLAFHVAFVIGCVSYMVLQSGLHFVKKRGGLMHSGVKKPAGLESPQF